METLIEMTIYEINYYSQKLIRVDKSFKKFLKYKTEEGNIGFIVFENANIYPSLIPSTWA